MPKGAGGPVEAAYIVIDVPRWPASWLYRLRKSLRMQQNMISVHEDMHETFMMMSSGFTLTCFSPAAISASDSLCPVQPTLHAHLHTICCRFLWTCISPKLQKALQRCKTKVSYNGAICYTIGRLEKGMADEEGVSLTGCESHAVPAIAYALLRGQLEKALVDQLLNVPHSLHQLCQAGLQAGHGCEEACRAGLPASPCMICLKHHIHLPRLSRKLVSIYGMSCRSGIADAQIDVQNLLDVSLTLPKVIWLSICSPCMRIGSICRLLVVLRPNASRRMYLVAHLLDCPDATLKPPAVGHENLMAQFICVMQGEESNQQVQSD